MKFSLTARILLTIGCFAIAFVGFMVKLPGLFRGHDKELHTLFYFLAAGFLNVLFVKRNVAGHVLVFVLLYLMGMGIEYVQEYSNTYTGQRIHGRYDPEDVKANLNGLIYFSIVWVGYIIVWYASRSMRGKTTGQTVVDMRDEAKIDKAIQLLTEVADRNPGDPACAELQDIIQELKVIVQKKAHHR